MGVAQSSSAYQDIDDRLEWPAGSYRQLDDGSMYALKGTGNLYLVMERVNSLERKQRWLQYCQDQDDFAEWQKITLRHDKFYGQVQDPLSKMRKCIGYYDHCELWICYAIVGKPSDEGYQASDLDRVEMAVAVLTRPGLCFQLHMGIARGVRYHFQSRPHERHSNLAVLIHAFAALVTTSREPTKLYMVTTPLPIMTTLLQRVLPIGSYHVGTNNGGPIDCTDDILWTWGRDFYFRLYDLQTNTLLYEVTHRGNPERIPASNGLRLDAWFFNNVNPSEVHPFVTVDLKALAHLIPIN